jgi:hypothetical protein
LDASLQIFSLETEKLSPAMRRFALESFSDISSVMEAPEEEIGRASLSIYKLLSEAYLAYISRASVDKSFQLAMLSFLESFRDKIQTESLRAGEVTSFGDETRGVVE